MNAMTILNPKLFDEILPAGSEGRPPNDCFLHSVLFGYEYLLLIYLAARWNSRRGLRAQTHLERLGSNHPIKTHLEDPHPSCVQLAI
jgi:hypothetical protein